MKRIRPIQSDTECYTAHGGLALVGQAIDRSGLDGLVVGPKTRRGIGDGDILKTYLGLLAIGKTDFEAVEAQRGSAFFRAALGIERVPSAARLRQRLDASAMVYAQAADVASVNFLARSGAPVSPLWTGHVALDLDLFPQDNSGTRKEGVGYTYKGYDGYGVMAAYLGQEGWCLANDLKPGSENGQLGFGFVLDRVLPAARKLTSLPLLMRIDSAHDALDNRVRADAEELDFLIKWNPRRETAQDWLAQAEQMGHWATWTSPRPGKRVATFSVFETRRWQGREVTHRRVMRVIERCIDKQGQRLLIPELEVEGWWTSLELADDLIIDLYRDHATSEQFHSEFKTDLDLERLPSGKFDTNTGVMALGGFIYNILRWIGLEGLIGEHAPLRHPAKRRRLRTVMQELVYLAGKFYQRGRAWWLRFGCHCPAFAAYRQVDERLRLVPG